jgi:hypothetical protein
MSRRNAGMWLLAPAALVLAACTPAEPGTGAAAGSDGGAPSAAPDPRALALTLARAAETRDYATLAAHMAEQFSYSFGQEPSRAGAIEAFRADPGRLDTLAGLLRGDCAPAAWDADRWYVCPEVAARDDQEYYGWRAGFRQREDGTWELAWFIAGD